MRIEVGINGTYLLLLSDDININKKIKGENKINYSL